MTDEGIMEAAALWHARQDADDMDWSAFESWLDADPRHRDAFDEVALLDGAIDRHRDTLRTLLPIDPRPVASSRWFWRPGLIGGACAATAAVLLVVVTRESGPIDAGAPAATYRTEDQARDLRIAGVEATLAPGSSLAAAGDDRTRLTLAGRASFSVAHDPSRIVRVLAQGYEIRDVGTRFEIVSGGGIVRVSVSEGAVELRATDGSGPPTLVTAGRAATGLADGRITTGSAARAQPDGWRSGSLTYEAMPLGLVAADVARASGQAVVADPAVADRPFSGVLAASRGETMAEALATLAGLEARRQGDTIRLGNRVRR